MSEYQEELGREFMRSVRKQDFDDLQNELNGVDTGRLKRFLSAEERDVREGRSGKNNTSATLSRLQLLLASSPAYAALYNEAQEALDAAEQATQAALAKARAGLRSAQSKLDETLENAARLPNGTRVFRDAHGQVWTEDGEKVMAEDAASIVWRGDEPSFEQYTEQKETRDRATATIAEIEGYQVDVLGRIRDRMSDEDEPPTESELKGFKREIEQKMPDSARAQLEASNVSIDPGANALEAAPSPPRVL